MEVRARSFRGFTIVGRGVTQEMADQARARAEALLEQHGVTAADIQAVSERYIDLGAGGVDLNRLSDTDRGRYGIDPKHARANAQLHKALEATRKLGALTPCSYLGFRAEPVLA